MNKFFFNLHLAVPTREKEGQLFEIEFDTNPRDYYTSGYYQVVRNRSKASSWGIKTYLEHRHSVNRIYLLSSILNNDNHINNIGWRYVTRNELMAFL